MPRCTWTSGWPFATGLSQATSRIIRQNTTVVVVANALWLLAYRGATTSGAESAGGTSGMTIS